jgi:hypothetical protein
MYYIHITYTLYIIHIQLTDNAYYLRKQSVICACIEDSVRKHGAKLRHFPPPSLIISNLRSCTDNQHTDNRDYTVYI